ncbi:hybrid sensor histidine kinase/response regulator [Butyrivibrio sp. AE3004]|uniref:hybrid sensor histidine kinase/response regulator n=1 Tax=Butyrivibrio sp. AE3004 TaxID=1506994 RepID=UPI000493E24F|nr:response regulator [Butyrivibrio sp. AE3004]
MNDKRDGIQLDETKVHLSIIVVITIACFGLIVESITEGWEYWVPPLIVGGVIAIWFLHITQYANVRFRNNFFLVFSMLAALFHGVHESSFFDMVVIFSLLMATFSQIDSIISLKIILVEYLILMAVHTAVAFSRATIEFNSLNISRIALHVSAMICLYHVCKRSIKNRIAFIRNIENVKVDKEQALMGMDDFLSRISHELRTPVNVVTGISTLILKKEKRDDVTAIRNAGIRLARQIEDIQDYTEIERKSVSIEVDKYMITSLINEGFINISGQNEKNNLEIVIDLAPSVPTTMKGDVKKIAKIIRLLIDNAVAFTNRGGIYIKIYTIKRDYGVNLVIEVKDTGIGMTRKEMANASKGFYEMLENSNQSAGRGGLGLGIVFGFAHKMDGFVTIESEKGSGTAIRVSIPQEIVDSRPCLSVDNSRDKNILFYVNSEKYKVPEVREYITSMAMNMAEGLRVNMYSANNFEEFKRSVEKRRFTHVFTGADEYSENTAYFDSLSKRDIEVIVSAQPGFKTSAGSRVVVVPKPLYAYELVQALNGKTGFGNTEEEVSKIKPVYTGVRALIVDDEPMNLIVATGLFENYKMKTDTATSGKEAIEKFKRSDYDVIFMDHMMPEMDGVEAMKIIKNEASNKGKDMRVIALTANAISGAREMLLREGFDGFITKPIEIQDFERTMKKVLPESMISYEGGHV